METESDIDIELEATGSIEDDLIVLQMKTTTCTLCKVGKVVPEKRGRSQLLLYTRDGVKKVFHQESRCNNRAGECRIGHYYGFVTIGNKRIYDNDVLANKYLVTSSQTAFEVKLLWDLVLQLHFSRGSFEALDYINNNLHLTNLPEDVLQKR